MEFKLEEIDGIDDEILDDSDEENNKEFTDEEEFDPLGVDKDDDEEDATNAVYEPDEPDEDEADDEYDDEDEPMAKGSSFILGQTIDIAPFNEEEENNLAFTEAIAAYYDDNDYEQAIEKFNDAIENEKKQKRTQQSATNEILAKAIYWQAESYVKTHDIPKAIKTFESLVKTCRHHYLTVAAQRRAETLKAKHS